MTNGKIYKCFKALLVIASILALTVSSLYAQAIVSGVIIGSDGQALPGATVEVIGKNAITTTDTDGRFSIPADLEATIRIRFLGYTPYQFKNSNQSNLVIQLIQLTNVLDEVVVIGYGTQTKKDLTGAISSVQEKDFNKGNFVSLDQLIQGRIAGVQITNSSGQPGVSATFKIRGNSVISGSGQPLFVVDGVPLSGLSARPTSSDRLGTSPEGNPLNFINPADIASIDVLKDASASAIYGSRAAYGVVMVTTKKGKLGEPKLDFALSTGLASIQHKVDVLSSTQFRQAIKYYGVDPTLDKGSNSDGLESILRTGKQQNYSVGISGGNNNGKYRFSIGYLDQEGILLKSQLKKYSGSLSANLKFLESKRLGMDINMITSQYTENIPFIRNGGGILGNALTWNPTAPLRNADGSLNLISGNPLAISELTDDNSKVTSILASIAPYYEITDWLEFKTIVSVNYNAGIRRASIKDKLIPNYPTGSASIYNNESYSNQLTSTLTFHKNISPQLNLTAIAGFEYQKFTNKNYSLSVTGPPSGFGSFGLDYTDYIQYSNSSDRSVNSYSEPILELQSYFGRAIANYKGKYIITSTLRADGSSKFGKDNKYGYFPSVAAAWIISEEDFMKTDFINLLKLRIGWGKTGNQEFPSGSAVALYNFTNNGGLGQINNPNPDLRWQSDQQFNVGIDFAILNKRILGTLDYFNKTTTDLLYPSFPIQPSPPGSVVRWLNLDGKIQNKGLEVTINSSIIKRDKMNFDLGFNATFIKNEVSNLISPILTGSLDGAGTSGVTVQEIRSGAPLNSFFTRNYLGLDKSGFSLYEDNGNTFYNVGNPNPTMLLGINTMLQIRKFSFTTYMYGAFGQSIYNNTLNSTLAIGQITVGNNIASSVFENPVKESTANYIAASSRYIEKGDYLKMGNATVAYNFGNIGKIFKDAKLYFTAQNVFTITNYSGFNPEVNINKSVNGVPSVGIDYQAYPSARTMIIGCNFSLR